jgi:DNA polymerase I-like protein with 3'-5' exonuclease and polymerase domains
MSQHRGGSFRINGLIHADIHPFRSDDGGTRTSRFSYSDPPLQQAPKHDEELAPLVRRCFLPEQGARWCETDLAQQEFRLAIHYAVGRKLPRAQEVLDLYISNPRTDFHQVVGDWTGNTRQTGKGLNFGKFYGIGIEKFAVNARMPIDEARRIFARYDRELPFISILSKLCERIAQSQGYIALADGTRRHFNQFAPGGADMWKAGGPCGRDEALRRITDPDHPWYRRQLWRVDTRNAFNSLIQGTAARQVKLAMRIVWGEGICPLLQMHDSLSLSVDSPRDAELVARALCEAMTFNVPMIADTKYGANWAAAKHDWKEHCR